MIVHGCEPGQLNVLSPLLLFRAHCPSLEVEFVPHKVAHEMFPEPEICVFCQQRDVLVDVDDEKEEYRDDSDDCTCEDGFHYTDWSTSMVPEIRYTEEIQTLIHNGNDQWLNNFREEKMAVSCHLDSEIFAWTIRLQFFSGRVSETLTQSGPNQTALQYLKSRGIADIPKPDKYYPRGDEMYPRGGPHFNLAFSEARQC
jgi:hypothetical protein